MKTLLDRVEGIRRCGSEYLLNKEVKEGRLFKLEKGVYSDEENVPVEAILSFRYKDAVFSGLYALYHHGYTDLVPEIYDLATDRDASKIADERVRQIFLKREILRLGAMVEYLDGYPITIHDKERTLVELLRNKPSLPHDLYKECVQNARKMLPFMDIGKIEEYAKACPKGKLGLKRLEEEVL